MTCLIIGVESNAQTTLSGGPAMVMAHVKPIAMNHAIFLNLFATNAVRTPQNQRWLYKEIARIDPAQSISDPVCAYILVVNESSQRLFSLLTLCIRILQTLLAPVQQWYTAARLQSTPFADFEQCRLQ